MPTTFSPSTLLALIAATAATVWLISAYYLVNSPAIAARRSRAEPGKVDDQSGRSRGRRRSSGPLKWTSTSRGRRRGWRRPWRGAGSGWAGRSKSPSGPTAGSRSWCRARPETLAARSRSRPPARGRTRFEYAIEYGALRGFLVGGWIVQGCGLVTLAVLYWALGTYVATNPNPAIRWQSVQMIQCIHLIWPPFLLGYRYRAGYGLVRRQMDTAIKNLPHTNG